MPEQELEPLITECPSCRTRFRVAETQLQRAGGRVRCGACLTVFHGIEHLVTDAVQDELDPDHAHQALDALLEELAAEDRPAPAAVASPALPLGPRPQGLQLVGSARDAAATVPVAQAPPPGQDAAQDGVAAPDDDAASDQAGNAGAGTLQPSGAAGAADSVGSASPDEADTGSAASANGSAAVRFGEHSPRRPGVWLAIVAGLLLLIAQVLWYQFDDWAKSPAWRSVYAPICEVLGCELPVQRDIAELDTRNLVVRSHPRQRGALMVNTVIVNRAGFSQPFPVLELQFTSVAGNLVASRRFDPADYLAGDAAGMTLMPPRTPVQIELSLDDPGPDAVNYRLNFH